MSEELTPKEEAIITQIETTKIALNSGDVLMVTIKCDDLHMDSLDMLKKNIGKMFPNNKVAVLGMGVKDGVEFTIVSPPEVSYSEQEQAKDKE